MKVLDICGQYADTICNSGVLFDVVDDVYRYRLYADLTASHPVAVFDNPEDAAAALQALRRLGPSFFDDFIYEFDVIRWDTAKKCFVHVYVGNCEDYELEEAYDRPYNNSILQHHFGRTRYGHGANYRAGSCTALPAHQEKE